MNSPATVNWLTRAGLFNHARFYADRWRRRDGREVAFFKRFLRPGEICFDVGANVGQKADVFLACGAKVVSVEPQPECARFLRSVFRRNANLTVIEKGLDAKTGEAEIFLSNANALSSMSQDFIQATRASGRCEGFNWDRRVTIATTTLDALIKEYGVPRMCKVDVEGYELNVFKGLSQPIPFIVFEMAPESIDNVKACIRYLDALGEAQWNRTPNCKQLVFEPWTDMTGILRHIDALGAGAFGDIIVNFKTQT